jgi:hypothetical protein
VQWAVNAYLVVSAACIVLGGEAADRLAEQNSHRDRRAVPTR